MEDLVLVHCTYQILFNAKNIIPATKETTHVGCGAASLRACQPRLHLIASARSLYHTAGESTFADGTMHSYSHPRDIILHTRR